MYIAIDIGGTKTMMAGFSAPDIGTMQTQTTFPTPQNYQEGYAKLKEFINKLAAGTVIEGIGVSFAGPIRNGIILLGTHLPQWKNQPLGENLSRDFNTRVRIDNDAVCAALAERYHGEGDQYDRFIYIIIGTGLGGVYVEQMEDKNYLLAMEPEYMIVNFDGNRQKENFATKGLLGSYATGRSLELTSSTPPPQLADSDPIWDEFSAYIAIGINNLSVLLNPEMFIFSGGLIQKRPHLINKIREQLSKYDEYLNELTSFDLKLTTIPDNASLFGALALFKN